MTVTLTNANQNYDLATLVLAVSSIARIHGEGISIQAAPANTADVLIGDASMTGSVFNARLAPSDVLNLDNGAGANRAHLNAYQARGEAAGLKLNINVDVQ